MVHHAEAAMYSAQWDKGERGRVLCGSLVLIEGARREGERDYDGRLSKRERER